MNLTRAAIEEPTQGDAQGASDRVVESGASPVEGGEANLARTPLPPMAPGLPVLGHALELAGDSRPFLIGLYRRLGPIFRLRVLNQTMTVLAGPEANQFFSQAGSEHFRSRELWQAFASELGSDHLMNAIDGPEHAWQRKVMKPGFARQTMLDRLPEAIRVVDQACAKLAVGREIAVLPFMQAVVTEQLGVVLTGRSPGEYMPDIRKMVRLALNTLVVRKWPKAVLWSPGYRRAKARVRELANVLIAEHRALAPPARRADMIDDLIAAHEQRPELYTDNDLRVGVVGPYIAGLDTVANTCAFMLRALLSEPGELRSVIEEVDTVMDGGALTAESLKDMHALHGAAMETLRLYPVAALSQRTATRSFTFAGYRVDADTPVLIATALPHMLPELFPNPQRFDIARYRPPRNEHRVKGAYAPFGLGAHTCLGAGMAEVQIAVVIARVLYNLEFELTSQRRPPLRQDPTLTFGPKFRIRLSGRRRPVLAA